mgnify:FL=1
MTEQFSTLSGWMIPFTKAMEACQIDSTQALQVAGFESQFVSDQESRIAVGKFDKLLEYCNQQNGREDFSILVAQNFHPGVFHALSYAMMTSSTLKDAMECLSQYKRVVSNTCRLDMVEEGPDLVFDLHVFDYHDTNRKVLSRSVTETFLATMVQFSREVLNSELILKKVKFCFPKPGCDIQYLLDFFQCEVEYNAATSVLVFDSYQASRPLLGGNPEISQAHEKLLNDLIGRVNKDDLTHAIVNRIYETLPKGAPSQVDIANDLNLSLRNLQRKLNAQGTSYKDILEGTRKKLTLDYLDQKHLSLSEISYLVGFSNTSNFNRAFKRWTNKSPGEYRTG